MALGAIEAVRGHWPEYLIEAAGLALFMISAGAFGTLLEYPQSPVRGMLPDPLVRRALMGMAMGATAIGLIYSRWGRQSGAHFNPAVTLAFTRLGKVAPWDGVFYVIAQFVGGLGSGDFGRARQRLSPAAGGIHRDGPGLSRPTGRLSGRVCHLERFDAGRPLHEQSHPPDALYRAVRRRSACRLHNNRGAVLRDEYEPGAHPCLGGAERALGRLVDLILGAAPRHADRRRYLSSADRTQGRDLRQAQPHNPPALHLPALRLQRACRRRAAAGREAQPEQCGRAGI